MFSFCWKCLWGVHSTYSGTSHQQQWNGYGSVVALNFENLQARWWPDGMTCLQGVDNDHVQAKTDKDCICPPADI